MNGVRRTEAGLPSRAGAEVVPAEVKARGQQVQAPYQQGKLFIEAIPQQDPASREDAMLNSGIVLANANVSLRPDRTPPHPPQPVKATPMTATSSPRKQPSSDSEAPTMPPPISWSATTHCCFLHGRSIATEPPFSWTEIRAQSMAFDVAKLLALDIMKKTKCRHNGWAS